MLKRYQVLTEIDAFFLSRTTDREFIKDFFNMIPHTITPDGVLITTPDGDYLIPFDRVYVMFDVGSGQLLSIDKDKFEKTSTEIVEPGLATPDDFKQEVDNGTRH